MTAMIMSMIYRFQTLPPKFCPTRKNITKTLKVFLGPPTLNPRTKILDTPLVMLQGNLPAPE